MTYQSVDNQHRSGDIVMLALSDDVPSLTVGRSAFGHLDWGQVGAEVARELIDEKTLSVRGLHVDDVSFCSRRGGPLLKANVIESPYFDRRVGKSSSRRLVTLLRLLKGSLVELGHGSWGSDRAGSHQSGQDSKSCRVLGDHLD